MPFMSRLLLRTGGAAAASSDAHADLRALNAAVTGTQLEATLERGSLTLDKAEAALEQALRGSAAISNPQVQCFDCGRVHLWPLHMWLCRPAAALSIALVPPDGCNSKGICFVLLWYALSCMSSCSSYWLLHLACTDSGIVFLAMPQAVSVPPHSNAEVAIPRI